MKRSRFSYFIYIVYPIKSKDIYELSLCETSLNYVRYYVNQGGVQLKILGIFPTCVGGGQMTLKLNKK